MRADSEGLKHSWDFSTPPGIREMEPSHLEEVLGIEAVSSLEPWSDSMFLQEMTQTFSHCFIIQSEGEPAAGVQGFICFRTVGDESEISNLAVHPEYRRKGVGKSLMQFYIDFCRKRNIRKLYLEASSSNQAALSLYRSFSYQTVGIRPKFYQHRFDAVQMMKNI